MYKYEECDGCKAYTNVDVFLYTLKLTGPELYPDKITKNAITIFVYTLVDCIINNNNNIIK